MKTWQPDFPVPSQDKDGRLTLTVVEPEPGFVREGDALVWQGQPWRITSIQRTDGKTIAGVEHMRTGSEAASPGPVAKPLAKMARVVAEATDFLQVVRDLAQLRDRVVVLEEEVAKLKGWLPKTPWKK